MKRKIAKYKKGIAAALSGLVALAAAFGVSDFPFDDEAIAGLAGTLATLLVVFSGKNEE